MLRFRLPYAVLTVLYCAGIFVLSAQPNLPNEAPNWLDFPGIDKVAHTILYAGLALVVRVGLTRSNPDLSLQWRILIPILFAAVYGMSDEIHQLFVPNRSFELLDLLADTGGATIMTLLGESRRGKWGQAGTPAR